MKIKSVKKIVTINSLVGLAVAALIITLSSIWLARESYINGRR